MDKSSVQTTLSVAQTYIASPTAYAGQLLAVTNDSTDNNGAYIVNQGVGGTLYLEKIGSGGGNADAPTVHRVTNNSATLSLPTTGDDYLLLPNNSYVYEVALNSLSLDLSAITGSTTNTDYYSGYSCMVYFQTGDGMTTFTVTHNDASYIFGDYTSTGTGDATTYTFNVTPSTPYVLTIKDNVVTLGPGSADSGGEEIILSALESIRDNVGLEPDYTYVNKPDPIVISGATDIKGAIFLLDDAIGAINNTILSMGTDISTMESAIVNLGTDITNIENTLIIMGTDIADIYQTLTDIHETLTDLSDNKRDKGRMVYDTIHIGTYTLAVDYNTSYIYANATGFTTLTVNLANVTGTPTSTEFSDDTYEENVYFKATSNSTTLVLNNCNATCVFGQYEHTGTSTTYTFSGFNASSWYCLSIKDNNVVCGPISESELSLVSSTEAGLGLITGLSVDGHTITYKHNDFSATDTTRFLRHDGTWQTVSTVSGVYGTCSTASDTAAKTVTMSNFTLQTGVVANITFSNTNTAGSPTLNIGNTGAIPIYYNGAAITTYNDFEKGGLAGATISYAYDGSYWVWLGNSVDTSRQLCEFTGVSDSTKGFTLSGSGANQTLTVSMYPNKTYFIGNYTSSISTLVLNVTNVMQADSIHTPIHYESIAHFYNGYQVKIQTGTDTPIDAENFSPSMHYGSYADLQINQICFLSITDNVVTFGPTNRTSTDGYLYPYTLPVASSSVLGGVKTGFTSSDNNYAVNLSNQKMYTTIPLAGRGSRGTMIYPNIGSGYTPVASPNTWQVATNGIVCPVELSTSNEAFVRVPASDNIEVSGDWMGHGGDIGGVLPTLTCARDFEGYTTEETLLPSEMWIPNSTDHDGAWCAVPVVKDPKGRLVVALPTGILRDYARVIRYPWI